MGGSQSTADSGPAAAEVKTSYYELIGVERSATEDEIKKAYRRKALELHPDRNYGNVEEATRLFAEVQSAYEVLSDPQERAWYDSHETAILRGEDGNGEDGEAQVYEGNIKITTADDITRMVRKFNGNVSFTDAPSGFYGYLRETFEHLAKEEEAAVQWNGGDTPIYPSFGHKDDDYDDVVKSFYAAWAGFATRKTFKWKDKYRLSEAPDRRYRRAMEKENQKLREDGIREFNDAVRSLVAFVKKRDPRYVPTTQSEAERQKALRDAAASQSARDRKANEEKLKEAVPEWAQIVQKDDMEGEIEDSESEEEHFECMACRKTFKSEKQFEAHEKSKKHQKAVQALKKKMRKENQHLALDDDDYPSGNTSTPGEEDPIELDDLDGDTIPPEEIVLHLEDNLEEQVDDLNLEDEEEPNVAHESAPEKQTSGERTTSNEDDASSSHDSDSDYASPTAIQARLSSSPEDTIPQPKQGKAAQKRAKKAAAAAASSQPVNTQVCAQCSATFPSKTRLFQHIKDFGHAAPKPASASKGRKKR